MEFTSSHMYNDLLVAVGGDCAFGSHAKEDLERAMKLRSPDVVHHHVLEFLTTRSHYGVGLPKKEATVVSIKLKQTNKQTNKNPTTTAATKEKQQNQTSCSHKRCFLIKTGTESVSKQNKTKNKQKNFRTKVPSLFSVFPFFPTFFLSSSPVSSKR